MTEHRASCSSCTQAFRIIFKHLKMYCIAARNMDHPPPCWATFPNTEFSSRWRLVARCCCAGHNRAPSCHALTSSNCSIQLEQHQPAISQHRISQAGSRPHTAWLLSKHICIILQPTQSAHNAVHSSMPSCMCHTLAGLRHPYVPTQRAAYMAEC